MVPSRGDGKRFIKEITRLIYLWTEESSLENIAIKAIHAMSALLFQKPNKISKTEDRVVALERRLELWENDGNIIELLNEGEINSIKITNW